MKQRTLVILKPDCVRRGLVGEVISRFERKGLKILDMQFREPHSEVIQAHYREHAERAFYAELIDFMLEGPIVAMVLEGPWAIEVVRRLVGRTSAAAAGTIRGDFAAPTGCRNIVHASDSTESALAEIKLFFGYEEGR